MRSWKNLKKEKQQLSVFEALSLMIAFGALVATILSNKKDK